MCNVYAFDRTESYANNLAATFKIVAEEVELKTWPQSIAHCDMEREEKK